MSIFGPGPNFVSLDAQTGTFIFGSIGSWESKGGKHWFIVPLYVHCDVTFMGEFNSSECDKKKGTSIIAVAV